MAGQARLPGESSWVWTGGARAPANWGGPATDPDLPQVGFFPSECVELFTERPGPGLKAGKCHGQTGGVRMGGEKWGLLRLLPPTHPFHPIVCPADADGPPCGIPAPQGISSLTSGNRNRLPDPCPCPARPLAMLTPQGLPLPFAPTAVPRPRGKLAGLLRTFMRSRPSRQRLRQRGILRQRVFGCDLGEHLSNSGQDGEAWAHPPHPSHQGCGPPSPDLAFSQCPRCCAAAPSSLRPTGWWMGSTGYQACLPTSRGFGEGP